MKTKLLVTALCLLMLGGALQSLFAQCAVATLRNPGPCSISFLLMTDTGVMIGSPVVPSNTLLNFAAPAGTRWVRLISIRTTAPCTAFWNQNVFLPLGPGFVGAAPLPAPYVQVVVNGCIATAG